MQRHKKPGRTDGASRTVLQIPAEMTMTTDSPKTKQPHKPSRGTAPVSEVETGCGTADLTEGELHQVSGGLSLNFTKIEFANRQ
jgi:hypothetical protein